MAKREISNLDLKTKLTNEYLNDGGTKKMYEADLLKDFMKVKSGPEGKVDPDTVSSRVRLAILADHYVSPFFSSKHISEYQSTLQKATVSIKRISTPRAV